MLSSSVSAQSTVCGLNVRGTDYVFTTQSQNFAASFMAGPEFNAPAAMFAIDFDVSATVLWGVLKDTSEYGTINLSTGDFNSLGVSTLPLDSVQGLSAAPDGTTWYACCTTQNDTSELWRGDVTTGQFALVGTVVTLNTITDLAVDLNGDVWGHSITDDSLYAINAFTGLGTPIGTHGFNTQFAPGNRLRLVHRRAVHGGLHRGRQRQMDNSRSRDRRSIDIRTHGHDGR